MATCEKKKQLRPGIWQVVNDRYPGSMITKEDLIPLAALTKPLEESRLCFVSTAGVQPRGTLPFDTVHPVGDYTFRTVPSDSNVADLEIHQIKYPTTGANRDLNVIFPVERLRELVEKKCIGSLTEEFISFIGYNMAPELLEETLAQDIAEAVVEQQPDVVLLSPA